MCIVTNLNVNLPHITVFYVGLLGMIIIVCVLIVVGIIGHTYYNVLVPIRQLQVAAIHISEGDLEYELPSIEGSEFDGLYKDFDTMQTKLRETTEERNRADALTKEVIGNISHDLKNAAYGDQRLCRGNYGWCGGDAGTKGTVCKNDSFKGGGYGRSC